MNLIQKLKTYSESLELSEDKKELLNCFLSNGFPTIKNEEWKYTSLKKIVETEYTIEDLGRQKLSNRKELDEAIEKVVKKNSLGFENRIVFVDGAIIKKPNINGVRIDSYSDFKSKTSNSILQLNAALAKNGFTISVEENIVLEKPIEILFLQTEQLRNSFCQFRNLIHVGDNSNVKFIEQIQNLHNTNSLVNHFTQINCGKNTSVEYNKIQNNTSLSIQNLERLKKTIAYDASGFVVMYRQNNFLGFSASLKSHSAHPRCTFIELLAISDVKSDICKK